MSEHPSEQHQLHFNGQLIETDAKGYLRHSEEWSEARAPTAHRAFVGEGI